MRLGPLLDILFAGEPGKADWVLTNLRERMDVSAWSEEWTRAQRRRISKSEELADKRRTKARIMAQAKRRQQAMDVEARQ